MKNYSVCFGIKKRGDMFRPLFGLTVSTSSKLMAKKIASEIIENMTHKEFESYLICKSTSVDYQSIMYAIDNSCFDLTVYHCQIDII